MWTALNSDEAVAALLQRACGFHDSHLRELSLSTPSIVARTSATLHFEVDGPERFAFQLAFDGLTELVAVPAADGCDSIVLSGELELVQDGVRLSLRGIGAPVYSPDEAMIARHDSQPRPLVRLAAESASWQLTESRRR
jgi:hypothetical protein